MVYSSFLSPSSSSLFLIALFYSVQIISFQEHNNTQKPAAEADIQALARVQDSRVCWQAVATAANSSDRAVNGIRVS